MENSNWYMKNADDWLKNRQIWWPSSNRNNTDGEGDSGQKRAPQWGKWPSKNESTNTVPEQTDKVNRENAGQAITLPEMTLMVPYQGKDYVQSDAVTQAQQALQNQQANKPGAYQSQFQNGMNDLMGQIQNRPKFQYDVNSDALYQQVAQNYMQQGQQAMMDTMGQAAALTGGYGNSYAQNAGQQAYNQYLLGLSELVPQYKQMAFQQYQAEGDDLLNRYNLMMQQDESAYARYQDDLNRYYADLDRMQAAYDKERDYDYSRFADDRDFGYGKYQDELNYQYKLDRDKIADEQWIQQLMYQQERDKIADKQWQKEYDEMVRQYNENLAFQKEQASKSSSRSSTVSSTPVPKENVTYTYNSVRDDIIAMKANGSSNSEIQETINQAYKEGIITDAQRMGLSKTYNSSK